MKNRFNLENKNNIEIHDFNNLQKLLSINIYDIVYVENKKEASDKSLNISSILS